MSYRSPWSWRAFALGVAALRGALRLLELNERGFIKLLVEAQNRRVLRYLRRYPPRSVLLILPRCVKRAGCPIDVRGELAVCLECQTCPLGEVARLTERSGVRALVAFRSHIAFAMARREAPDLIIALACEDRLVKALRNVPEIPALLAPLDEMTTPCLDAEFDLAWLARQVEIVGSLCPSPPRRAAMEEAGHA